MTEFTREAIKEKGVEDEPEIGYPERDIAEHLRRFILSQGRELDSLSDTCGWSINRVSPTAATMVVSASNAVNWALCLYDALPSILDWHAGWNLARNLVAAYDNATALHSYHPDNYWRFTAALLMSGVTEARVYANADGVSEEGDEHLRWCMELIGLDERGQPIQPQCEVERKPEQAEGSERKEEDHD